MKHWLKSVFVAVAPLLLASCLWGPGKFASDLTLRKDGSFVLDYRGQIVLETADAMTKPQWQASMAHCTDGAKQRPCTASETAEQKLAYDKKRQEDEQTAKAFGLPGADEESNRAFAAKLMKYAGWRSVSYAGKGVYDVDYHMEGRLTQDFVFPLMPDSNFIIPFIAIRRRADAAVLVQAPGLAGGTDALGPMAQQMGGDSKSSGPRSRADGRFTVHTDGEIVTNNSEDGPAADPLGRQVHWDIAPGSNKVPEALVRF
jgi:hypothetical protein